MDEFLNNLFLKNSSSSTKTCAICLGKRLYVISIFLNKLVKSKENKITNTKELEYLYLSNSPNNKKKSKGLLKEKLEKRLNKMK